MAKSLLESEGVTDYVFKTVYKAIPHSETGTINHWRWGGFVISSTTATEWASRITGKELTVCHLGIIVKAIEAKVRPLKAGFEPIGDSWKELTFMVVTRAERLIDYQKDSPVPQFEEGEREARAKPLLEREGVTDYAFKTVHEAI